MPRRVSSCATLWFACAIAMVAFSSVAAFTPPSQKREAGKQPAARSNGAAVGMIASVLNGIDFVPILREPAQVLAVHRFPHDKRQPRPRGIDGLNTFVVSGVVKQGGATVALSGIGADELFGGYPCFAKAQKLARFLKPLAFVPPRLRRSAAAAALAALPAGKRAKAVDLIAGGGSCVELAASLRRVTSGRDLRSLGLDPKPLELSEQYLPASAFDAFTDPGGDPFNAVSQAESFLYMGNTLLRDADVNSMAHSLEIRVPFLGRWLVDLVGAMPGDVKAPQGGLPKHLLRKAAGAILPHDLFSRPKRGFTLPIGEWMFGPLRGECEAAIDTLAGCSALDGAAVRRLWDSYRSQPGAIHWSRPLALVVLGNSLRR